MVVVELNRLNQEFFSKKDMRSHRLVFMELVGEVCACCIAVIFVPNQTDYSKPVPYQTDDAN